MKSNHADQNHSIYNHRPQRINSRVSESQFNPGPYPFPEQPIKRERDLLGKEPPGDLIDWSHRKGEPRVLALLWMIYLLIATTLMFSHLASGYSIAPSISRPASREMLVIVIFGMSILWPMARFSQTIARPSIVGASVRDLFVILIPMQAVIWPQKLIVLGGWSTEVVFALTLHCAAWGLVTAGVISVGSILIAGSNNHARTRAIVTLASITVVILVPIIELVTLKGAPLSVSHANLGWMLSPITGIMEITADRRVLGQPAMVFRDHFRIIAAVACVGLALLVFGRALENAKWVARRRIDP